MHSCNQDECGNSCHLHNLHRDTAYLSNVHQSLFSEKIQIPRPDWINYCKFVISVIIIIIWYLPINDIYE